MDDQPHVEEEHAARDGRLPRDIALAGRRRAGGGERQDRQERRCRRRRGHEAVLGRSFSR